MGKNHWKDYAKSIGAQYVEGVLQSDRIIFNKNEHTIIITIGTNQRGNIGFRCTRFRCSYTTDKPFFFSIRPKKFKRIKNLMYNQKNHYSALQKHYSITTSNVDFFSRLTEDAHFKKHFDVLTDFKFTSEKDDGEYGPVFLADEYQFCLEIQGEIEDASILSAGIGIILASITVYTQNGLIGNKKSTVNY